MECKFMRVKLVASAAIGGGKCNFMGQNGILSSPWNQIPQDSGWGNLGWVQDNNETNPTVRFGLGHNEVLDHFN